MATPAAADKPDAEGGEYPLVEGYMKLDPALFFDTQKTRLQLVGPKFHACIFFMILKNRTKSPLNDFSFSGDCLAQGYTCTPQA